MKERVFSILNIKMSESKYVFDLLTIQLFIGLASAFINIVAFTSFIYNFSISGLPYAFLSIAVVLLALNLAYEKLEHRFAPLQLLKLIIASSILIVFLIWTGFAFVNKHVLIFVLLIWNTLFYMVSGYAFWGLVSLLFNVRESKRVFSIVGSGDIPAKLIGYLVAPLLIPVLGLNNLLLLAVVSLLTSVFLLNRLMKTKSWEGILKKADVKHQHKVIKTETKGRVEAFFKNNLIFTISLLSILSYNVFILVDYTFISQVKAKFHDLIYLATFIAQFFAVGRLIALVLKLVFSSRAIERLGIIPCLSITPVTLFLFSLAFFTNNDPGVNVYIFGVMALLTEVLRSTIQDPVFLILFQPLSEHLRLKGHIIAKGYMFPVSLVVVGLSLIFFPMLRIELTIINTVKILLVNLVIWAVVIFLIKKAYIHVLHSSIRKGVYSSEEITIYDQKTIDILLNKISHNKEGEVIYALKLLESACFAELDDLLENQLYRSGDEVKKYVLDRLNERGKVDTNVLKELLANDPVIEVKEKVVSILCRNDRAFLYAISEHIAEQDYRIQQVIIIHLLNQSEFTYLYKAGKEINNLISSTNAAERKLALTIISELKNIKFTDAIENLMNDADTDIKRKAIAVACKLRVHKLLPYIIELLRSPADKYVALQGLYQYGDQLFIDLQNLPPQQLSLHLYDLIKIAGKVKGPASTSFLLSNLAATNLGAERIIHALWSKGYEAEVIREISHFQNLLKFYLKTGLEKIYYYNEVPKFEGRELLISSIISEIKNDLVTSLELCALLYHKKEINRVLELVENSKNYKLFNAMEMLEMVLPKRTSFQINSIIDFIIEPTHVRRPFIEYDIKTFFKKIIVTHANNFNDWTKAVCIYCLLKSDQLDFLKTLDNKFNIENSAIMLEARTSVQKAIQ